MRKRIAAGILALIICLLIPMSAVQAGNEQEHWNIVREVLFGKDYSLSAQTQTKDVREAIDVLRISTQICIDQTNGNDVIALKDYRTYKVPGTPKTIEEIDLVYNGSNGDHRQFTHKGWDYDYTTLKNAPKGWNKTWQKRQKMMLHAAEDVFNFNGKPRIMDRFLKATPECDMFCRLLYTLHIFGDHKHYTKEKFAKGHDQVMPVVSMDQGEITVISELILCCEFLCGEQDSAELVKDLDVIQRNMRSTMNSSISWDESDERFEEYQAFLDEIQNALSTQLPSLLKKTDFFRKKFYSSAK